MAVVIKQDELLQELAVQALTDSMRTIIKRHKNCISDFTETMDDIEKQAKQYLKTKTAFSDPKSDK